jgi:hypothetical protein
MYRFRPVRIRAVTNHAQFAELDDLQTRAAVRHATVPVRTLRPLYWHQLYGHTVEAIDAKA